MKEYFFITTAIDYPNGNPHMGHAYEKVVSDFYARYHRLKGKKVHFLTGTDENGQKLKFSAQECNEATQDFVDKNVAAFRALCDSLQISYDDFIRTTENRHREKVQQFWKRLQDKRLIYQSEYTDYYCQNCESFYTVTQLLEGNQCPEHFCELSKKTEQGYFFKLSHFHSWLTAMIEENPEFILPRGSRSEILSRLKNDDLRDLSISRPHEGWGIEVPGDDQYVIYTWFDALMNYYSALGSEHQDLWPATCHVIGRDITWFHGVIWPAILKALDLELPRHIYVHGMVLADDGRKMSKSLGNGIDPQEILKKYPGESFRFYLLKAIPSSSNGRFSEQALVDLHNNSLANDYGNLLMRTVKLALKRLGPQVVYKKEFTLAFDVKELFHEFEKYICRFEHDRGLQVLWQCLQNTNQYINQMAPWSFKEASIELEEILFNCLYALHVTTYFLSPAMPETSLKILDVLGYTLDFDPVKNLEKVAYQLKNPEVPFVKIEN